MENPSVYNAGVSYLIWEINKKVLLMKKYSNYYGYKELYLIL